MLSRIPGRALVVAATLLLAAMASPARAWEQWAYNLIDVSSQWSDAGNSALQVLDLPTVTDYGNANGAWAPATRNGTIETITVGFLEPLYAEGAIIRENQGNGFVTKIEALDNLGSFHTVWSGTDPSAPNSVVDFRPTWTRTAYPVQALRVTIDTGRSTDWEEIDAIGLVGQPTVPLQWASRVIAFSSEYNPAPDDYSSAKAVGVPDVTGYRDDPQAWAPGSRDGTIETITLGFPQSTPATGVTVRETCGNGFITKVEALDTNGAYHTVWTGTDPSQPGAPAWFSATWAQTAYSVQGVRITVNTSHTDTWEEIDAVYLHGEQPGAPRPSVTALSPESAYHAGEAFTLTVTGQGFLNSSVVQWNGADRPTTFITATRLTAQIAAADIAVPGSKTVTVYTPPPGGGTSAGAAFSVSASLGLWASVVLDASSQFNPIGDFSAQALLGPPDVPALGDNPHAWTSEHKDMGLVSLSLGYSRAVQATGVMVRQTLSPGFMTRIDLLDTDGAYHTAWTGTDPSPAGALAEAMFSFPQTAYAVRGVRVWVDTNHAPGAWEEIDAVQLIGLPVTVPAPAITGFGRTPLLRGGPAPTILVHGTGFQPNTVVRWNGADRPTAFLTSTRLAVTLTSADVAASGTAAVSAFTPAPGGGLSPSVNLAVGPAVWGDATGNGALELADAGQALKAAAGLLKPSAAAAGDVSPEYPAGTMGYGDGSVTIGDVLRILRRIRGQG